MRDADAGAEVVPLGIGRDERLGKDDQLRARAAGVGGEVGELLQRAVRVEHDGGRLHDRGDDRSHDEASLARISGLLNSNSPGVTRTLVVLREKQAAWRRDTGAAELHDPDLVAVSIEHVGIRHDEADPQPSLADRRPRFAPWA